MSILFTDSSIVDSLTVPSFTAAMTAFDADLKSTGDKMMSAPAFIASITA